MILFPDGLIIIIERRFYLIFFILPPTHSLQCLKTKRVKTMDIYINFAFARTHVYIHDSPSSFSDNGNDLLRPRAPRLCAINDGSPYQGDAEGYNVRSLLLLQQDREWDKIREKNKENENERMREKESKRTPCN